MKFIAVLLFNSLLGLSISAMAADPSAPMLSDRHQQKGVPCAACHAESAKADDITDENCTKCHGSMDAMGEKSEGKFSVNPHAPHSPTVTCIKCHHGHKASENYCNKCHEYDFVVK